MSEQAPEAAEAPPDETTETPETPEAPERPEAPYDLTKLRNESKDLRAKLKAEVAGRDAAITGAVEEATLELRDQVAALEAQLVERDAQLAAVGKLRNPADVTRFVDVTTTPPDKIGDAIAALLKERPYLGVVDAAAVPQGAQTNGREPSTGDASKWLRDAIIAKGA